MQKQHLFKKIKIFSITILRKLIHIVIFMTGLIYLQKIGPVDDSILLKLKKNLKWAFRKYDLNVKVLSYELPLLYKEYHHFKKQYDVDQILNRLKIYAESKKYFRILGVINQDIFSKLVDFRFGCAKYPDTIVNMFTLLFYGLLLTNYNKQCIAESA